MHPTFAGERIREKWCARRLRVCLLSGILIATIATSLVTTPGVKGLFGAWLAVLMLTIARVDARRYIIPNSLTAAAFGLALLDNAVIATHSGWAAVGWTLARAAVAAIPLALLKIAYIKFRGRDGLGTGDIKLAGVAGAWLDWTMIAVVIEIACLSAIAAYAAHNYRSGKAIRADAALPFGLFLAPAIWLGWLIQTLLF
jgi:leader peptidase (prepilin peptidase)/N-methyltransferase